MSERVGPEQLTALGRTLGIDLDPEPAEKLALHLALLEQWNARMNLTAIRDPLEAARRHALEALAGLSLLPETPTVLADIGSGNGFPGLPLLVSRPDLRGLIIEASLRKCDYLQMVTRKLDLGQRVTVRHQRLTRADQLPEEVGVVSMRGFPDPASWIRQIAADRMVLAWLSDDDGDQVESEARDLGRTVRSIPLATHSGRVVSVTPLCTADETVD